MKEHSALCAIVVLTVVAAPWACGNSGGSGASPGADSGSPGASSGGGNTGSSSGSSPGSSSGSNGGSSSGSSGGSSGGSSSGASSGSSGGSSGGSSSGASDAGEDGNSGDGGPAPYDFSVYQHHKNGTRDGVYIDPVFTQTAAATTHVTTFSGVVSTTVYAQPLYVVNGPNGTPAFIVATEDNNVTAYNATTGAILWNISPTIIGPFATKHPPGGSIATSPSANVNIGITGTPYIDIASRTIFFDALTSTNNTTYLHKVFAANLDSGDVETNWPVDVDSAVTATAGYTFNSAYFNQRGALQFLNGVLYVPYGGYNGDGTPYWGSVVGFPVASPQTPTWWHTTASQGGVWGPGSLPTDGTSIFPVTGNTARNTTPWGGGEAVIRLAQGPTFSGATTDYFAPSNWADLDSSDSDLGGASEVLIDMPGAQYPHLVLAGGKDGNLYVLNRDNLGGIGGQLLIQKVTSAQIKGAPAAYTTALGTYVALHIDLGTGVGGTGGGCPTTAQGNMVVMKITQSPMAATTAWCSTQTDLASPMVTTTDGTSNPIVWNADNALYAWDGDTGAPIVKGTNTGMSTAVTTWNTPIDAQGRIVVGVNGQLYAFSP